jgi:predicted DNA repair protein MutK
MFLVGGAILTHGIAVVHHGIETLSDRAHAIPGIGAIVDAALPTLLNIGAGVIAGALAFAVLAVVRRTRQRPRAA